MLTKTRQARARWSLLRTAVTTTERPHSPRRVLVPVHAAGLVASPRWIAARETPLRCDGGDDHCCLHTLGAPEPWPHGLNGVLDINKAIGLEAIHRSRYSALAVGPVNATDPHEAVKALEHCWRGIPSRLRDGDLRRPVTHLCSVFRQVRCAVAIEEAGRPCKTFVSSGSLRWSASMPSDKQNCSRFTSQSQGRRAVYTAVTSALLEATHRYRSSFPGCRAGPPSRPTPTAAWKCSSTSGVPQGSA